MTSPAQFLSELEIGSSIPYRRLRITKSVGDGMNLQEGVEQSFFSNKSIVSFASSVSKDYREGIMQTILLAQLAANKKVPDMEDTIEWFRVFAEIMAKCGWLVEGADLQTYKAKGSSFEVEAVIIQILTAAFGANYIDIVKNTLAAIKGLANEDKRIIAFKKNTQTVSKGYFQIALAVQENEAVSLQIGSFSLKSEEKFQQILFFRSAHNSTDLQYIAKRATFDPVSFSNIKEIVKEKIKTYQLTDIAEINI